MKPYSKYKHLKRRYRTTLCLVYHRDKYITYDEDAKILHQLCHLSFPKNKPKIKIPYDNIIPVLKTLVQNSDIHSDKDLGYTRVGLIEPENIELKRTKNLKLPKSPIKQYQINQAKILVSQIIEEIQDLSSDQGIVSASDTDIQKLTEASNIISNFNSKQEH